MSHILNRFDIIAIQVHKDGYLLAQETVDGKRVDIVMLNNSLRERAYIPWHIGSTLEIPTSWEKYTEALHLLTAMVLEKRPTWTN